MKKLILAVLLMGCLFSQSQILINTQLPPIGLTLKSQLWNLSLINSYGVGLTVQIKLNVTEVSTNQLVFTAVTRPFFLPPSAKQVTGSDLLPITYTGANPAYRVDGNPNGFLPVGVFNFCYTVTSSGEHGANSADESCDEAQVEPISPPMLMSPADSEHVDNSKPMFIWIPPQPASLFSNLSYDFHLVEINPTQSAADAVQQNIPVLFQPNLRAVNLQYPLSAPALDSTKLYAWEIVAKNNGAPVATSEAWAFRLKKDTVRQLKAAASFYSRLSRDNGSALTVCNGVLHFAYLQETNATTVHIDMTDITSAKQHTVALDSTDYSVHYGDNLMNIDLVNEGNMKQKHFYLMDLTNGLGEHWYLKFEYLKQD